MCVKRSGIGKEMEFRETRSRGKEDEVAEDERHIRRSRHAIRWTHDACLLPLSLPFCCHEVLSHTYDVRDKLL